MEYQNAAKVMHKSTLMAKSPDSEDCSSNQAIFGIKHKNKGGTGALWELSSSLAASPEALSVH